MTREDVRLPKIALGAWAWGNDGTFGKSLMKEELRPIFDTAMENGLNLWDTAYAYGMGASEKVLAGFLKDLPRDSYLVSDKFTPQCADPASKTPMEDMIQMQLARMGLDRFDIYWIHNAWDAPAWTEKLAKYYEGRADVPLLGVSNHSLAQIREADEILKAHGLRLSAVQNHYSLLNRASEDSGILAYCRENGIRFFAYMVLEQGALSGKYDTAHPMPEGSARAQVYNPVLDRLESVKVPPMRNFHTRYWCCAPIAPIREKPHSRISHADAAKSAAWGTIMNRELRKLADRYGVDAAQIPVAWAIAKGTIPIVGVTKTKHVEDAVKAANVRLTDEEIRDLEETADSLGLNLVRMWEGR